MPVLNLRHVTTCRYKQPVSFGEQLMMDEAVRSLGFAARFLSGYLYIPEDRIGGRAGGGATHAWLRVCLPGAGWVEFDPANGIVGNHDLIRMAAGRDPRRAVPVWGTWTGSSSDTPGMTVEVEVTSETALSRKAAVCEPAKARDCPAEG